MKNIRILLNKLDSPAWDSSDYYYRSPELERKEKKDYDQAISSARWDLSELLDSMSEAPDPVKEAYTELLGSLEYINNTNSLERHNIYPQLSETYRTLSWPDFRDNEYAQRAIKVLWLVFMDHDAEVSHMYEEISSFLDDETVPENLKQQMVEYLCWNYFWHLFESEPDLGIVDRNSLDEDLKFAYDFINSYDWDLNHHWKIYEIQDMLYSPKYRNSKYKEYIKIMLNVINNKLGSWSPMHDFSKTNMIIDMFKKEYPQYEWTATFSTPLA